MQTTTIDSLRDELREELTKRILPFWMERTPDEKHGGFVGRITHDDEVVAGADKGAVLNARILWTFSAAFRVLGDEAYRAFAERAFDYVRSTFHDAEHGGYHWMVAADGRPIDDRKHVYAQAFVLYGLSEYYRATGHEPALGAARELFELVERRARDAEHGGYHEAFDRSWSHLEDARLSDKDANERKSMNTHLHLLEAYTNLHRIWPNDDLCRRLHALTEIFVDRIYRPETRHFLLFFDDDWNPKSEDVSFGHDIEAAWLLLDAAAETADDVLSECIRNIAIDVARVTSAEGQDRDGGLYVAGDASGVVDDRKDWWPQAEAVVGFTRAYELTGEWSFFEAAEAAWEFIKRFIVDTEHGEWYGRVSRDGVPDAGQDKVGPWKCPYHNARLCLELIERTGS